MKNDKSINRSALPGRDSPSGFQPPHKPGYDVVDTRGPGEIKDVGDMADRVYGRLDDADLGASMARDATNRLGGFGTKTHSDDHNASEFQHPAKADKDRGENSPETVESQRISGCGSDEPFDRFPDRQRSNAARDADD